MRKGRVAVGTSVILSALALGSATNHGAVLANLIGGAYGSVAAILGVPTPQQPLQVKNAGTPHQATAPAMQATPLKTEEELSAQYAGAAEIVRAAMEADITADPELTAQVDALRAHLDSGAMGASDINNMLNEIFSSILAGYGESAANPNASVEAMSWRRTLLWEAGDDGQ